MLSFFSLYIYLWEQLWEQIIFMRTILTVSLSKHWESFPCPDAQRLNRHYNHHCVSPVYFNSRSSDHFLFSNRSEQGCCFSFPVYAYTDISLCAASFRVLSLTKPFGTGNSQLSFSQNIILDCWWLPRLLTSPGPMPLTLCPHRQTWHFPLEWDLWISFMHSSARSWRRMWTDTDQCGYSTKLLSRNAM